MTTVTGTDGLQITTASYDPSSQTLTVNVGLTPGNQAPTNIYLYESPVNDIDPGDAQIQWDVQQVSKNATSVTLTATGITPDQMQAWL